MNRKLSNTLAIALILGLAAIAWNTNESLVAQDAAKETTKAAKKAKGRLPNYYADVVDGQQRELIYQIQAKFRPQIEKLEAELAALKADQDKEIEAILRPEQKKKVDELRAAAEAKRKQRRQKKPAEKTEKE